MNAGLAAAISAGTLDSCCQLSVTKTTMIPSGIRIEMMVRGCRSRRPSEICSGVTSSSTGPPIGGSAAPFGAGLFAARGGASSRRG